MRKWHRKNNHKKSEGIIAVRYMLSLDRVFWSTRYTTNVLSFSLFDAHHEAKSPHLMFFFFFLSFFFFWALPLFSLAALVHALHVRPSCYYKLLGGLTSLIANTDNGTILTQGLTSVQRHREKLRIWEIFSAATRNPFPQTDVSICPNVIFWLIHPSIKKHSK